MRLSKKVKEKLQKVIAYFIATGDIPLKEVSAGCYRTVYSLGRDHVLKFEDGDYFDGTNRANKSEYINYKRNPRNKAKCMLVPGTGGRFLIMERVYKLRRDGGDFTWKEKIPSWVWMTNDNVQSGYNKKGELVRYDYQTKFY